MNEEDRDDAMMRALFADAPRPPLADERFVGRVMAKVARRRELAQAQVGYITWAGVAAAAFLFLTNGAAIVAELSRAFMALSGDAPAMSGSGVTLLLAAAVAGGTWIYTQRA